MHRAADTMSGIIADDPVSVFLRVLLNGPANISDTVVHTGSVDAQLEAFFGDPDQLLQIIGDLTDRHGHRGISDETLKRRRHVERNDVALVERIRL